MGFYETIAQVIPVLVVAFVLQTKQRSVIMLTRLILSLESKSKLRQLAGPTTDDPASFVIKMYKRSLSLVFIAEVAALWATFAGGAPWPFSLLVWPGLIVILWMLFAELQMSVSKSIDGAAVQWYKKEIKEIDAEIEEIRKSRNSQSGE